MMMTLIILTAHNDNSNNDNYDNNDGNDNFIVESTNTTDYLPT